LLDDGGCRFGVLPMGELDDSVMWQAIRLNEGSISTVSRPPAEQMK